MDEFTRKHAAQLTSAGIPEKLHGELRRKLEDEVFDAGEKLFIALVQDTGNEQDEGGGSTEAASTAASSRKVVVRDDYVQDGGEEVFLVDHAWTFQAGSARQHLGSSEPLLERMAAMMQVPPPSVAEGATAAVAGREHPTGVTKAGDVEDVSGGGREGREAPNVGVCSGEERGVLEGVLSALPTFSRRYGLGSAGRHACYVNDELGSALRHSENPNFQMAPFLFSGPSGVMAFSVLWPLRRLLPSEEATVDLLWSTAWAGASTAARGSFVRGLGLPQSDLPHRLAEDHQYVSLPKDRLAKRQRLLDAWAVENRARKAATSSPTPAATPSGSTTAPAAFPGSGENNGIAVPVVDAPLPVPTKGPCSPQLDVAPEASSTSAKVGRDSEHPLTVWTDLPYLCNRETGLTRSEFRVLESGASPRGADVLWASRSIDRNFEAAMGGLLPGQLVNQFPYEAALVIKSHLARTIQREFGSGSPEGGVMQPTFDLQSEDDALAFIAEFRRRCHDGLENIWIVKPIGLARSMDTTVTGALAGVLRAADTGPKVAQLYLSRPLLWKGRKFDLRVVALLVSTKPLELYVHKCYWPRVAERPHDTEREASLEDPRVSLTATHLVGGTAAGEACHPHYEDFARDMQGVISEGHPGSTWESVLVKTRSMIASVFQAAARQQPGMASPRARAMYGCDVMITEDLEPRLLEVTFSPANLAASPAWPVPQPEFLNEAFGCLFLGEQKNVTRLS